MTKASNKKRRNQTKNIMTRPETVAGSGQATEVHGLSVMLEEGDDEEPEVVVEGTTLEQPKKATPPHGPHVDATNTTDTTMDDADKPNQRQKASTETTTQHKDAPTRSTRSQQQHDGHPQHKNTPHTKFDANTHPTKGKPKTTAINIETVEHGLQLNGHTTKDSSTYTQVIQSGTDTNNGATRTSPIPTTTIMKKSTTCASTTTLPALTVLPGPTPKNPETRTPIDETMARAMEPLQISNSTTAPTTVPPSTLASLPWTLVANSPQKPCRENTTIRATSHEFGLAFERTTKGNNWSTGDLLLILQTIRANDPKAMLSSADNKTKPTLVTAILHQAQKDTPWFTKFTAMKTMTWGKPTDGTTKIVFSFWLTSTIIKKDLAQLQMDSDFTEMLKGTNTYMKVTKLLEPHRKIVGYFLGKDIIHTNRDDITNRLAAHITKYSHTIWTPALDVLNTTVLGKGHNTRMVTLVVGNSDYQGVLDILTQQPMETLSFLDHRTKRYQPI